MRFPLLDQVGVPVTFERFVAGELHADGRRYLPLLVFKLTGGLLLGVVDRHHYVDPAQVGSTGIARIVCLLSQLALQRFNEQRQAIIAPPAARRDVVTMPEVFGRVVAVPSWELQRGYLPYETLYAELLLDVGDGVVGVRTSVTADNMEAALGTARFEPGDWVHVSRSRLDILGYHVTPHSTFAAQGS